MFRSGLQLGPRNGSIHNPTDHCDHTRKVCVISMSGYTGNRIVNDLFYKYLLNLSRRTRPLYFLFRSFYLHHVKAISRKVNGYQFGVLCCAWTSGIVLLLNVLMTIWAGSSFGTTGGIGTLQAGSCTRSSDLGFWIHLVINVLSTTLLGASNYTMVSFPR